MTANEFSRSLRELLEREPFQKFTLELRDGRRLEFNKPSLQVGGKTAMGADRDGQLVTFDAADVNQIVVHPLHPVPLQGCKAMSDDEFFRAVVGKLERQPFQPFTLKMLDGRDVEIVRPHSVTIRGGKAGCFDRDRKFVRVNAEQVANVIDLPESVGSHQ